MLSRIFPILISIIFFSSSSFWSIEFVFAFPCILSFSVSVVLNSFDVSPFCIKDATWIYKNILFLFQIAYDVYYICPFTIFILKITHLINGIAVIKCWSDVEVSFLVFAGSNFLQKMNVLLELNRTIAFSVSLGMFLCPIRDF